MQTIKIGSAFFKKERSNYSNWLMAFWRELFQNSVDANSKNINIHLSENDGYINVSFDDDGCGMSRDILENVYFCMGESGKDGLDTVGGFGKARILTCFGMKSYRLHTGNIVVSGSGAEYSIDDIDKHYSGVSLSIDVDSCSYDELNNALEEYLSYSQLNCNVFINGVKWNNWLYKNRLIRNTSFGNIYCNKSKSNYLLVVRVNGTYMFSRRIRAKAQVVVEIKSSESRKVLLSNRDGFSYSYQSELDDFLNKLAADTTSALRSTIHRKSGVRRGTGVFHGRFGTNKTASKEIDPGNSAVVSISVSSSHGNGVSENTISTLQPCGDILREDFSDRLLFPDIYIEDNTLNTDIRKVIDNYDPRNWKMNYKNGKKHLIGGNRWKLLQIWKIILQETVEVWAEMNNCSDLAWSIGWCFDDYAEAMHSYSNGVHYYLINPVNNKGNIKFSLRSKDDHYKMIMYAVHEVCHTNIDYHDESFASMLTELGWRMNARSKNIFKDIKDLLNNS